MKGILKGIVMAIALAVSVIFMSTGPAMSVAVYTVSGSVTDSSGALYGADVVVNYHDNTYTGKTDGTGHYTIICDRGSGPAVVSATFKGGSASYKIVTPNSVIYNDIVDLYITYPVTPTPTIWYQVWGQVYVNDVATDGVTVSTTWGSGATTTSRTDYGLTGLYQLYMTPPPSPAPVVINANYNGHTLTYQIDNPTVEVSDQINLRIYYSIVTATAPPATATVTISPTVGATASPAATTPVVTVVASPAGNTSSSGITVTPVPSSASATSATPRPPLFQTGYGEQLFLVIGALGLSAALIGLKKKD